MKKIDFIILLIVTFLGMNAYCFDKIETNMISTDKNGRTTTKSTVVLKEKKEKKEEEKEPEQENKIVVPNYSYAYPTKGAYYNPYYNTYVYRVGPVRGGIYSTIGSYTYSGYSFGYGRPVIPIAPPPPPLPPNNQPPPHNHPHNPNKPHPPGMNQGMPPPNSGAPMPRPNI